VISPGWRSGCVFSRRVSGLSGRCRRIAQSGQEFRDVVLRRSGSGVDHDVRPIPGLVFARGDRLPFWRLQSLDIRLPRLDPAAMLRHIRTNHLDLDHVRRCPLGHSAPGVPCHLQWVDRVGYDNSTNAEIFLSHALGDDVTGRTDIFFENPARTESLLDGIDTKVSLCANIRAIVVFPAPDRPANAMSIGCSNDVQLLDCQLDRPG
jgi:hypothetical protein